MNHETRIVDAFKSNAITRTLLIDDAYDPPSFSTEIVAALADFWRAGMVRKPAVNAAWDLKDSKLQPLRRMPEIAITAS